MSKGRLAIGCDHAGFEYKEALKIVLNNIGYEVEDFGTHSIESVDYPDYVHPLADSIESGKNETGILICGTANGVAITANKHQHIRAAIAWNDEVASLARRHNDANVLCLPSRCITLKEAEQFILTFLNSTFEGGRHERRVKKMSIEG